MARVTGLGGVFLRARDPKALMAWYARHLGVVPSGYTGANFVWNEDPQPEGEGSGMTVFSLMPTDTPYFGPGYQPTMLNFRVDDLDAMLQQLAEAGVWVDPKREDYDYGHFAWIKDLEDNRVELWQPLKMESHALCG